MKMILIVFFGFDLQHAAEKESTLRFHFPENEPSFLHEQGSPSPSLRRPFSHTVHCTLLLELVVHYL